MTDTRAPKPTYSEVSISAIAWRWLSPIVALVAPSALVVALVTLLLPFSREFVIDNHALVAASALGRVLWFAAAAAVVLSAIAFGATSATAAMIVRAHDGHVSPFGAWRIALRRPLAVATFAIGLIVVAALNELVQSTEPGAARFWMTAFTLIAVPVAARIGLPRWVSLIAPPRDGDAKFVEIGTRAITILTAMAAVLTGAIAFLPPVFAAPRPLGIHLLIWITTALAASLTLLIVLAAAVRTRLTRDRLSSLAADPRSSLHTLSATVVAVLALAVAPLIVLTNVWGIAQFAHLRGNVLTDSPLATDDRILARSPYLPAWCDEDSCTGLPGPDYGMASMTMTSDGHVHDAAWSRGADSGPSTSLELYVNTFDGAELDGSENDNWADPREENDRDRIARVALPSGMTLHDNPEVQTSSSRGEVSVFVTGIEAESEQTQATWLNHQLLAVASCADPSCVEPSTEVIELDHPFWAFDDDLSIAISENHEVAIATFSRRTESPQFTLVTGVVGEGLTATTIDLPAWSNAREDLKNTSVQFTSEGVPVVLVSSVHGRDALLVRCEDLTCANNEQNNLSLDDAANVSDFVLDENDLPILPLTVSAGDRFDLAIMGCTSADCSERNVVPLMMDVSQYPPGVALTPAGKLVIGAPGYDRKGSSYISCTTNRCGS